ncbi:rhodanese-related sulfurtransferase [uncultured Sphingomonas sp.]|uniref:oxygen-dependent tRNA uridine(34) hydroxylase TrhO n=1 Tax=uncultured Sphingomonas sp. TaxID=158754 RepID=UPI0025E9D780|nr:rhodanese-related sulfurtransferase [uncultured Sphingomonas sp.]
MTGLTVAALYRFTDIADPSGTRDTLEAVLAGAGVRGTLLIATEGVNGTIAGSAEGIATALAAIRALPGCEDLAPKFSHAAAMPFHRLKVRVKQEIVTMGVPGTDPTAIVGTYVAPADWNALIADPETVVIDTRNAYEVKVGTFAGAVDPHTDSFRDFPDWFRANRTKLLAGKRKVAMFCTGGIRCEKSTAFLKGEGIEDVYHLDGGILKYLEDVPVEASAWEGECFVFDERVAVGHGLEQGTHALCRGCRMPVSPEDRASPLFEEGVQCPACAGTRDAATLAAKAERHRQVTLAAKRGEQHVGRRMEREED